MIMNTKTKIYLTAFVTMLAAAFFTGAQAQNSTARYGIKGGLNVSNLYSNTVTDENARIGFNAGLYGQILSSEAFAIQTELLYTTKGSQADYNSAFGNQNVKFNLNYLELPILAVFKLGSAAEIHAGGYASYLLNANINYTGAFANGTDQINRDNLKSGDAGLVAGFGLNFGSVQVGARYNYGLVEIANTQAAKDLLGNSKNSAATVYIAFNLNN